MVSAAHVRPAGRLRAKRWIVPAGVLVAILVLWWRSGDVRDVFGRHNQDEEDLTVDLDGSGSMTVNASLAALSALRGLDVDPLAQSVDREHSGPSTSRASPVSSRYRARGGAAGASSCRSTSSSTTCGN